MKQRPLTNSGLKYLITTFIILVLFELLIIASILFPYTINSVLPNQMFYILTFLAIITFFIGTFYLWRGREEIGKKHIENVEKGLWLIIIFLAITSIFGIFLERAINYNLSFFMLNLMLMLSSFYFLKNLTNKRIIYMVWIAIFLFVIFNPLETLISYLFSYDYYVTLYRFLLQIISVLIPYILLGFCYYKTYKNIKK